MPRTNILKYVGSGQKKEMKHGRNRRIRRNIKDYLRLQLEESSHINRHVQILKMDTCQAGKIIIY